MSLIHIWLETTWVLGPKDPQMLIDLGPENPVTQKLSKRESFRALKLSECESFRAQKLSKLTAESKSFPCQHLLSFVDVELKK